MYIASFDIGKKNFAFYIEEINTNDLKIVNIPLSKRYNADGTPTSEMSNILNSIYKNGKMVLFKNLDLTENCEKKCYLDPQTFINMNNVLDSYSEYWDKCSYFVIEQQMSFGKNKINTMALKLGQHCYSYFLFRYGTFKKPIEFPAYHKTKVLGCSKIQNKLKNGKIRYKNINKPQRKKWAVKKAIEILTLRNDIETLDIISTHKKKDDLADTLIQLQAFKFLYLYTNND